jgi:hypothetical protein
VTLTLTTVQGHGLLSVLFGRSCYNPVQSLQRDLEHLGI